MCKFQASCDFPEICIPLNRCMMNGDFVIASAEPEVTNSGNIYPCALGGRLDLDRLAW